MKCQIVVLAVLSVLFVAVSAVQKCCPQPENDDSGKCGCCPDACCCICDTVVVSAPPVTPPPTNTPRPVTTSQVCVLGGLDIFFVVDKSLSVGDDNWAKAMTFLGDVVASSEWQDVGTATKFGMISFNTVPTFHWGLGDDETNSVANLQAAFSAIPFKEGFTNTPAALDMATEQFQNDDRDDSLYPDVAVVVADGLTNIAPTNLPDAAANLQDATGLVFAVGISNLTDFDELNLIADGDNNESVFWVENFGDLEVFIADIVQKLKRSICETITQAPLDTTTPMPTTTPAPIVTETCRCCCPPLPDPCDKFPYGDACCCRFHDAKKKR